MALHFASRGLDLVTSERVRVMKILIRANVYGWIMTGLLGKKAEWFFGYSRRPVGKDGGR